VGRRYSKLSILGRYNGIRGGEKRDARNSDKSDCKSKFCLHVGRKDSAMCDY